MKSKLCLYLAFILNGVLFNHFAVGQNSANTSRWPGFNDLPPITNVNFSVTHLLSVRVPTKLKIERTLDTLSVTFDTNGFESTNLMVGTNAVTGVQSKLFIYQAGSPRPTNCIGIGQGALDFNLGTSFWVTQRDGFPQIGKSYIVETDVAAFETDSRGGHLMIFPWSTNYKIIWRRTLKQFVE
jgi:hypothetical protein